MKNNPNEEQIRKAEEFLAASDLTNVLTAREAAVMELITDGGRYTNAVMTAEVSVDYYKTKFEKGTALRLAEITKVVRYHLGLNGIYQNAVNNQREREGMNPDFVAKPNWFFHVHDRINGSIVAKKSDPTCRYLLGIVDRSERLGFLVNGVPATANETAAIVDALKPIPMPTNQGTDKPIVPRTIKLEGILNIRCGEQLVFGEEPNFTWDAAPEEADA